MKIKHILLTSALMVLMCLSVRAQQFAYVDSEYILSSMPEYVAAEKQLDDLSVKWQAEIDQQFAEIEEMYQEYQNKQARMSESLRRSFEDSIIEKEQEAKDLQRQKFGYEGDLFKERERLMKPIEDKVSKAIENLADQQNLDVIFDKSTGMTMLFARPELDKSKEVLRLMGYQPRD